MLFKSLDLILFTWLNSERWISLLKWQVLSISLKKEKNSISYVSVLLVYHTKVQTGYCLVVLIINLKKLFFTQKFWSRKALSFAWCRWNLIVFLTFFYFQRLWHFDLDKTHKTTQQTTQEFLIQCEKGMGGNRFQLN